MAYTVSGSLQKAHSDVIQHSISHTILCHVKAAIFILNGLPMTTTQTWTHAESFTKVHIWALRCTKAQVRCPGLPRYIELPFKMSC